MNNSDIRQKFFDFFEKKAHKIVLSAPMVLKNDPTLMFTNAGMNQFKEFFLGNKIAKEKRIANTQKCLRVSGKHNDLEEVGHDTYHHTMFEMLGNWSFGDYFKKEAIEWAWELLTEDFGIDKDRLYVTYFGGDKDDKLEADNDSLKFWTNILPMNKVLSGSRKDNFWEMGNTGPCGPCSEIHIDIRSNEERNKVDGASLVNKDHPLVIEIWNLVFINFNRKSNGELESLPQSHVDTGMGFERLCMVIQGKQSNYDTDIFQPIIQEIAKISNKKYGEKEETDVAIRVVADHLRAISFSIADGQLPSNTGAGYVIRRILRRAVRYAYTFLGHNEPFINKLLPVLIKTMGKQFPELEIQQHTIAKVIAEEESSFLRTLATGIKLLDKIIENAQKNKRSVIDGKSAFELFDTYGFPLDLTELILKEQNLSVDHKEYEKELQAQKDRSRKATIIESGDWEEVSYIADTAESKFVGYDALKAEVKILRYRKVKIKGKELYHLEIDLTPFYAEAGGQVGDTGYLESEDEKIPVLDTKIENNIIIHISDKLPKDLTKDFIAVVNKSRRINTVNNHSATHLMHQALRKVLGTHVEQKGSLVNDEHLRFDFSHFQKLTTEELVKIEILVNERIRQNLQLEEHRNMPMKDAEEMGAIALFGEKYGEEVRVIKFGDSLELCGGTHVGSTGEIGLFKIISESAIAAGIRRIEAITGQRAIEFIQKQSQFLDEINNTLSVSSKNTLKAVTNLVNENKSIGKEIENLKRGKIKFLKEEMIDSAEEINDIKLVIKVVDIDSPDMGKDLVFDIKHNLKNIIILLGAKFDKKANLWLMISENLVKDKKLNAVDLIKEIAVEIQGGGGGQPFFATAGGKKPENLSKAIQLGKKIIMDKIK